LRWKCACIHSKERKEYGHFWFGINGEKLQNKQPRIWNLQPIFLVWLKQEELRGKCSAHIREKKDMHKFIVAKYRRYRCLGRLGLDHMIILKLNLEK
jgi:hypothetical protein